MELAQRKRSARIVLLSGIVVAGVAIGTRNLLSMSALHQAALQRGSVPQRVFEDVPALRPGDSVPRFRKSNNHAGVSRRT
jgi:hypothetical protein